VVGGSGNDRLFGESGDEELFGSSATIASTGGRRRPRDRRSGGNTLGSIERRR
jgi:hypothetical protein